MSSSKLVPDDPAKVMVIRDVVPNTLVTLSTPFWRFGQIKIGGRGTIGMNSLKQSHLTHTPSSKVSLVYTSHIAYHPDSPPPKRFSRRLLPSGFNRRCEG